MKRVIEKDRQSESERENETVNEKKGKLTRKSIFLITLFFS